MHRYSYATQSPARTDKVNERAAAQRSESQGSAPSAQEEAFLSGITTSGQFSLANALNPYANVRRLRDQK